MKDEIEKVKYVFIGACIGSIGHVIHIVLLAFTNKQ